MRLYLARHGEAVPKTIDPESSLSTAGKDNISRIANMLGAAGIKVSRVFHSGKKRALQTAAILGHIIAPGMRPEVMEGLHPNDDTLGLFRRAQQWQEDVMVVGHLPYMARAVSRFLIGNEQDMLVRFKPGSVVCLKRSSEGLWAITWALSKDITPAGQ